MAAAKTKKIQLITKADIEDALSTYDINSIERLRSELKSKFPEKKKKASAPKPKSDKPKTPRKPRAKASTEPTVNKPKKDESLHKYKVGDKVLLYFGNDRLHATVKELLPNKCYCVEWLNFKENYNHPFVIGSPVKYVHESLCHDLMESEVASTSEDE